jgi:hypothetical protein
MDPKVNWPAAKETISEKKGVGRPQGSDGMWAGYCIIAGRGRRSGPNSEKK